MRHMRSELAALRRRVRERASGFHPLDLTLAHEALVAGKPIPPGVPESAVEYARQYMAFEAAFHANMVPEAPGASLGPSADATG